MELSTNVKPNFTLLALHCEQGNEVFEMDEQIDLNPTSSSLMVSKVTQ